MNEQQGSRVVGAILWLMASCLAAGAGCSSSSTTTSGSGGGTLTSSGGNGGTGPATSTTSGGGTAGAGGAGQAGAPPNDAGAACNGETPAGTAACGTGKTCHLATCGPPAQFACAPAGASAQGGMCVNNLDCGEGMNCIGYSATLRACEKQCSSDADCPNARCADYSTCNQALRGKFCLRACTDVTAAGAAACGPGFKCDAFCSAGVSSMVCVAAGTLRSGACAGSGDCAAGYTCIAVSADAGATGACTQLCRTNTDCTTGTCIGTLACGAAATALKFCQ